MESTGNKKYFARREFNYGGKDLDRGQILELGVFRNDDKLVEQGFLRELVDDSNVATCQACGSSFTGPLERNRHYDIRHIDHQASPAEVGQVQGQEERTPGEVKPLYK